MCGNSKQNGCVGGAARVCVMERKPATKRQEQSEQSNERRGGMGEYAKREMLAWISVGGLGGVTHWVD